MSTNVTLSVGHVNTMAIIVLDQNGNPMIPQPAFDAVPTWTQTTPATETLAPTASGATCVGTPVAAGTDLVTVSFSVGGVTFTAANDVTVMAAAQVPTSAEITNTVV
jgi:hypothetical protein